jgi:hypothetical protein
MRAGSQFACNRFHEGLALAPVDRFTGPLDDLKFLVAQGQHF